MTHQLEEKVLKELPKQNFISAPFLQRKFKISEDDAYDVLHQIASKYDVIEHYDEFNRLFRISMFQQMRRLRKVVKKTFLW